MSNFNPEDRARLIEIGLLARCASTGREFSVGPVEVLQRYADCTLFRCPECKGSHDDRQAWTGGPNRRMGYTVVTAPSINEYGYMTS